jgi:type I restriction enzyme, R subunit
MLEKHEVCCTLFHGFDRSKWTGGMPQQRLGLLPAAQEHILRQENGKDRCVQAVLELSQAFALAVPRAEALRIRDDVAFFQAVQRCSPNVPPATQTRGGDRPRSPADHLPRRGPGGCRGHLRGGGPAEARHLDPLG